MSAKSLIRDEVLSVLADGKWHPTFEIAKAVAANTNFAADSVRVELSVMRDLRTIERQRTRIGFRYRRTDVGAA